MVKGLERLIPWIGFEDVFHLHDNLNFYKMIKKKNTKYYRLEEGQFPIPRQFPNFHEEIFFSKLSRIFSEICSNRGPRIFSHEEKAVQPREGKAMFHRIHLTLVVRPVCPISQFISCFSRTCSLYGGSKCPPR